MDVALKSNSSWGPVGLKTNMDFDGPRISRRSPPIGFGCLFF